LFQRRALPPRQSQELTEAENELRDAKDDEAKMAARRKLADVLSRLFDDDLRHRKVEMDKIEERLSRLRDQLSRRQEKKQEIIDLQLKVIENEAVGLGFFSAPGGAEVPLATSYVPGSAAVPRYQALTIATAPAQAVPIANPPYPRQATSAATPSAYQPVLPPPARSATTNTNMPYPTSAVSGPAVPISSDYQSRTDRDPVAVAKSRIAQIKAAIDLYRATVGQDPPRLRYLIFAPDDPASRRRWAGPYFPGGDIPLDPWGNQYQYLGPGKHNRSSFDVWSFGPDGKDGTEDDIGNWPENK
jgi:general secretion pathway protein G